MTICIAALADNGKSLVAAVDEMITASFPITYEFETKYVRKIYALNNNVYALTAGDALGASTIIGNTIKRYKLSEMTTVKEVADSALREYQTYRTDMIVQRYFLPRGINLGSYYDLQQKLQIGLTNFLDSQLANYDIGISMLIIGCDRDDPKDCHIYSINNPGVLLNHDEVGFACIGTGAPHATYYLIGERYNKTKEKGAVYKLVAQAKKRSEVAPGVGTGTKFVVIPDKI